MFYHQIIKAKKAAVVFILPTNKIKLIKIKSKYTKQNYILLQVEVTSVSTKSQATLFPGLFSLRKVCYSFVHMTISSSL